MAVDSAERSGNAQGNIIKEGVLTIEGISEKSNRIWIALPIFEMVYMEKRLGNLGLMQYAPTLGFYRNDSVIKIFYVDFSN